LKKKIQFILNKPQLSENVGMSLRSIGCFGFENLSLINPRKIWPNEKGLKSAKHFSSLSKKVRNV
jgi:rRNA methylase